MASASVRPARWKEHKEGNKMASTSISDWRKFQQIPVPSTHALKLVSVSPSYMSQVLFKLLALCWDLESANHDFLHKPCWVSEADVTRCPLPGAGPPGWGSDPSLFGGNLYNCDITPT